MSKISELITQLCPNGVDYIPISELGTLTRGKRFVHADAVDKGIPCIHYGELYTYYGVSTYTTKSFVREELKDKLRYAHKNDVIIVGAGENDVDIGIAVAYLGDEDVAIHDACYILTQKNNPEYISYCLRTEYYHSQIKKYVSRGKICAISAASIGKAELPIPPLEIQDEIVHILDEYSEKTEKLCKELGAELTARKKQYEYYRDLLLDFGGSRQTDAVHGGGTGECEWRTLGEITTIIRGGNFQKKDFVEKGKPCIHYGQMYTHFGVSATETLTYVSEATFKKSKTAAKNDIIMAVTSENVDDVCKCVAWLGNEDIAVSGHTAIIKHNQNAKYLSYYFHTSHFFAQKRKLAHGTKVIEVTPDKLNNISIPIPSIAEQERIVSILDRFDKLCNDISEGLPAEIEARRKQYEYYRDKLLSFEEM